MQKRFKPVPSQVDFPAMEREILERWYKSGLIEKYLHKNDKSKTKFSFMDGPITANNPMGVHHAWGRTYKDLWQRYHTMLGDKQRYQNGFDCQGLWVEVEVEKELGFKLKKDIEVYGVAEFVNKCKERVLKYSTIQAEQSKRLGMFMDWENSYFTMSDENNYTIWSVLKECWQRGWIYKGHESVPWCPRCETAISQHEMLTEDYKELTHESVILGFPLEGREKEFLLVWTTTPWTIPANVAVAVDAKVEYSLVVGDTGYKFWVAKDRVEAVFKDGKKKILKIVPGGELVGLKYRTAFDNLPNVQKAAAENPEKFHTVVATDSLLMPISTEEGTGMVHTAVSAGEEDFRLGRKLGLPMIPVIADNADYLPGMGDFTGLNAKKNPRVILDYLLEREKMGENWVFDIFPVTHRYPACWRCKTELVWKVADEWYIAMDKKDSTDKTGRTLREELMDVTKKITWLPDFGLERELDWLANMHDWLISKKNRYWGLALPIYECKKCGHFEVIGGKDELEKRAVAGWDKFLGNTPHRPWIDEVKITCSKCGETVERIKDVGNPWLDAGIVSFSTLHYTTDQKYWREWYPAEFITESFPGQFKNWFYSLLVMGTILTKTNPFKTVLGFGTLLGEDGRPMHKSWGNAIEFNEGADKIGVDVMRWMYSRQNPSDNMLFGYKKADEVRRQFYLLLWNVYSFFVTYANIDGWQNSGKQVGESDNVLDRWILARLNETTASVTAGLNIYDAQTGALAIESFVNDLSTWYIRRSRDRVGPTVEDALDKEAFYSTTYNVLIILSKLLAPFTPFVAEEIYKNLTGKESVHLDSWPTPLKTNMGNEKIIGEMALVRHLVEQGHGQRKAGSIKVRQPLPGVKIESHTLLSNPTIQLIKDELNVKTVDQLKVTDSVTLTLNTQITPKLAAEGQAREIVRQIQDARKSVGTALDEYINVTLPNWPEEYTEYIKKQTLAKSLTHGKELHIKRIE